MPYAITGSITLIAFLLHLVGCYLLWKTYKWGRVTTQQLLIFHICICECFINCDWLVIHLFVVIGYGIDSTSAGYCIVLYTALSGVLYIIMMVMTLDRLMAVVLSLKYPLYWNAKRTKKVLLAVWIIGGASFICFVVLFKFYGPWYNKVELIYVNVSLSLLYIIVALVTYAVIFDKFKKSRHSTRRLKQDIGKRAWTALADTFLKSRFYVSILIILTYLIFNTIPFCVFIFSRDKNIFLDTESISKKVVSILLHIGYTADAVIYIFLQRDVKKQLFESISCHKCIKGKIRSTSTIPNQIYRINNKIAITTTAL